LAYSYAGGAPVDVAPAEPEQLSLSQPGHCGGEVENTVERAEPRIRDAAFQADDHLVFGNPLTGKPLARRAVLKRFKQNLARARVREVRFHELRHTFGTRMAAAGVPLRTLQEWMGHRDFKTTLIYADYQPSEQEAALVERAFGRQLQHEASATCAWLLLSHQCRSAREPVPAARTTGARLR
jgi:hypothetical protein